MFSLAKVSTAVLLLASFAQATITIAQPNIQGNATNTISWTSSDLNTDPEAFSIELINPQFNRQFAIANNVPTSQGSATFEWPTIFPGATYTIEFVDIGNINNVIATSGSFFVAENDVGTSAPSTPSSTAGSGSSASASSSASSVASATPPSSSAVGTVTQTGSVTSSTRVSSIAASSSPPVIISSSGSATPASASVSAASASASHSAAKELIPSGSFAALVAGALALLF